MRISFYTLGCRVNQYETEMLKERFKAEGYEIVADEDVADVYVINTCTVTNLADRKSRQFIRRMKRNNPAAFICVTGCYAQVSAEEVARLPGVDLVVGTSDKGRIPELIREKMESRGERHDEIGEIMVRPHLPCEEYVETGAVTSMEGRTRAFIKIQEGCNRFCTYCEIPFARGDVRSRQPAKVIEEVKMLLAHGFKEIVLTGINTALYGTEKHFKPVFPDGSEYDKYRVLWKESCGDDGACKYGTGLELLLAMLCDIEADFRIRISSLEPTVVRAEDVLRLLKYDKLCHHLHLSLQSGSNEVLRSMNRHYTREDYLDIAKALYSFDPCFGISADIIAGFPGESEQDFSMSTDIEKEIPFCKVHAFDYSKRPGTQAAEMKGHLDPQVKKRRVKELIKCGEESQKKFFKKCEGTERIVLVEEYIENLGMYAGYTDNYIRSYFTLNDGRDEAPKAETINTFIKLRMKKEFRDGMIGECI